MAESANRTKKGGQDLIGGLDVRVNRNHFGRQTESFEADIRLPFLDPDAETTSKPFNGIFIRAPVVEKLLPVQFGEQDVEAGKEDTVIAPSRTPLNEAAKASVNQPVEIMATLPGRGARLAEKLDPANIEEGAGDIIAVRQGNVFGTSFHPELTKDARIHIWWLEQVRVAVEKRAKIDAQL